MKKILVLALLAAFASGGYLSAREAERLRASAENIGVDVSGLKAASKAASKTEIRPTPVEVKPATAPTLGQLIVQLLRLIFSPNGDIEIQSPSGPVPQVDATLEDDKEEETYTPGASYDPVDQNTLPSEPFSQPGQPAQPGQWQAGTPNSNGGGERIPEDLRRKAMDYFNANQDRIQNKRYIGVVDFAAHSSRQRFWIIDLQGGAERAMRVAHGAGSDPDNDGYATLFSNVPNSRASSLGFYLTGELYTGKHGRSMRLHGLSTTNSNALSRAVVVHDSDYVREANVQQGRSFGCLAVANSEIAGVLSALRGGALIYAGLSNSEF